MNVTRLNISLEHLEVGLSGAVPDRKDWSEAAMDRAILEFVALLSGIVFKYGGRVVHGSHPTFTPVILRQARQHAGQRERKPVTLVMSELWASQLSPEDIAGMTDCAEFIVTKKIGAGGPEDAETRNRSLTAMRRILIDAQNVMVAVGGKMHRGDGMVPGVGEELELAANKGMPRFLVAGMGGFAAEYAKQLVPASLDNGLTNEQNEMLFTTHDVSACVATIFEHLVASPRLVDFEKAAIKLNPVLKAVIDHRDGEVEQVATGYLLTSAA